MNTTNVKNTVYTNVGMVKLIAEYTSEQNTLMADNNVAEIGGYKVKLREQLPGKLQCPFCRLLMRSPIQTCRGELACEGCYKQAISDSGTCPIDYEPIAPNQFNIDKFIAKEIETVTCFCINHEFGCSWNGVIGQLENHSINCGYVPVQCCVCEEQISKITLVTHLENCPKLSLNGKCIYAGCSFKPVNIEDLENHLRKDVVSHGMLHCSAVTNIQRGYMAELDAQKTNATQKQEQLERQMAELTDQMSLFVKKITETKEEDDRKISNLQEKIKELENRPNPSTVTSEDNNSASLLQDLPSKVDTMKKTLSNLDLRQQLFENTAYDGKLLWKIDNVSNRLTQAITGKVTALHSAPTFTSKYGYKFCGRLYLNGDGIGKGTHASMFFVQMKSEYDNLLAWPFNKRITMRLINQSNQMESIEESFDADVNSSSFRKPTKEMNVACGCPMFVSIENLEQFVKDDTIFIELSVSDQSAAL